MPLTVITNTIKAFHCTVLQYVKENFVTYTIELIGGSKVLVILGI